MKLTYFKNFVNKYPLRSIRTLSKPYTVEVFVDLIYGITFSLRNPE